MTRFSINLVRFPTVSGEYDSGGEELETAGGRFLRGKYQKKLKAFLA